MRKVLLALGILALICTPAMAGRNENGAMIVHTNDAYNYSSVTVCTTPSGDPGTCEQANTMATRELGQVVWLLAAFRPEASPGVTVVYFGINYDTNCLDPGGAYKFCGPAGTLEVADDGWPYTGFGNSVAFGSPVYDTLFPFYAFKIDNYCPGQPGVYFCTGINPTGGYAAFVDDGNPPGLDQCHNFGCVHWGEPGFNQCPELPPAGGACCFADGSCQVLERGQCDQAGGVYQGDGTVCDPNPCPQPLGACCFEDGTCQDLTEEDCVRAGGSFQGDFTNCATSQCPQPRGACCFADGTCQVLTGDECGAAGGSYQGNFTDCDPNPCPQPTAACCVNGVCTETTEADCAGTWFPGQHCDDPGFQCPPVATQNATWGQIKANYR